MAVVARFVAVLILCLVILGISNLAERLEAPKVYVQREAPDFGPAPEFDLIDQRGAKLSSEDLENKVYVAAFFFSSCRGPCPVINANMARLHKQFSKYPRVRFLSISVDPQTDTPEVLADYARKFVDPNDSSWSFLTGQKDKIYTLVTEGFKVGLSGNPPIHTTRAVLVDQSAKIVGFYDATDSAKVKELGKDISALLSKAPPA